ncbi:acyltransferase family protein [Kosakonia sacchari]|uniref:acyltransferase family protein n=1 Tax=Kosakonia sacchari TaxID=1158459 RepID=UPI002ACD2350|nr:acyltransferase family protein [Kosakonia sacchari]MDZ7321320.1 acyltransferase family protein [Kosakonia sacchari]
MKQKTLWINQIKGLCICLVVVYHSVITFYPHLSTFQHPWSQTLSKCWIYFNLYLAPFRMPVFFFISGYLIRRYIADVPWKETLDKRIWSIVYVLVLWGLLQWAGLSQINDWLAPQRDLSNAANAAYAENWREFLKGMLTASTSLWYLYALVVYFTLCKLLSNWKVPVLALMILASLAINYLPLPWWGMNSVVRNMIFYSLGAWYGASVMEWVKTVSFRRYGLLFALVAVVAFGLWMFNMPLPLCLLSIVGIMRLFQMLEQRFPPNEKSLLNVVGSNTLAIYTTHRILIEAISLALLKPMNAGAWPQTIELALLLVYPFATLLICTLVGLMVRKLSSSLFADLFFTPPTKHLTTVQAR